LFVIIRLKQFEPVTVEAVQSFFCSKPQKAVFVLYAAKHGVIGESVLNLIMSEII
jgi:hypothetical protein